jgi:predicted unusual protein kinase regulating ubiquinone biosynthesis (AarF/ABC1/UbiB family)
MKDDLITSSFRRFIKLGGLMGRVGASVAGEQVAGLVRSGESREAHKTENLVRNARRIVETLGELKGAAMKVGQMLSLHEGLLPPEVAAVLSALQKEAPKVPAEVIGYEIEGALPRYHDLFESLELEGFAAASIGQVHEGRLRDGRRVAVKIQYPLIDRIVTADLKNLRTVLQSLFALFSNVDFDPVWQEVRDRLLEELDYTHEAGNMREMIALHADVPQIVIPRVVDEATTKNVLTMEYVEGISPGRACSDEFDQQLKDRWGRTLFEFQLRGLLEHRFMHADPNLANFSFLPDGRVIVYDFGCVKRVPAELARGYGALFLAGIEQRREDVPRILGEMSVVKDDGNPLPRELTDPYVELFSELLREDPSYTFGSDDRIYREVIQLGIANMGEAMDLRFPRDVIFIDRSMAGHFGNLGRLRATGPWRELVLSYSTRV